MHGREEVVIVSLEEFRRVKGDPTGQALVQVLQESPLRDVKVKRRPMRARVRNVAL